MIRINLSTDDLERLQVADTPDLAYELALGGAQLADRPCDRKLAAWRLEVARGWNPDHNRLFDLYTSLYIPAFFDQVAQATPPLSIPDAQDLVGLGSRHEPGAEGTKLFLEAITGLDEDGSNALSLPPDWTRKHLAAHVAANAEAIGNLVHWAATGIETPMYRSPQERAAGISKGPAMSACALDSWLHTSAERLAEAMDRLTEAQWQREVVTAQGRTVPATETPWMRAREVCVHAVDLGTGLTFADLPSGFNDALCAEILAKRSMTGLPASLTDAPLPEVTAWLAGRPHTLTGAPDLGPWL